MSEEWVPFDDVEVSSVICVAIKSPDSAIDTSTDISDALVSIANCSTVDSHVEGNVIDEHKSGVLSDWELLVGVSEDSCIEDVCCVGIGRVSRSKANGVNLLGSSDLEILDSGEKDESLVLVGVNVSSDVDEEGIAQLVELDVDGLEV